MSTENRNLTVIIYSFVITLVLNLGYSLRTLLTLTNTH